MSDKEYAQKQGGLDASKGLNQRPPETFKSDTAKKAYQAAFNFNSGAIKQNNSSGNNK